MSQNQNIINVDLNTSAVAVYPGATVGKRRAFLTPIDGEPGNYLLVVDSTAAEKVIRCPTAEQFYLGQDEQHQNEAILRYFLENPTPPDVYRTPPMALMVMDHYREQTKIRVDYQDETLSDLDGLIVERPFELPLGVLVIDAEVQLPTWSEPQY